MKLMTKLIEKQLPKLYYNEKNKIADPMVIVKYFDPCGSWTWYGIEWDGKDEFFGYVVGWEAELGYFSLKELQSIKRPFGLGIERDKYFRKRKLSEIKKKYK